MVDYPASVKAAL
jgi:hypothetical protein